MLIAVIHFLLHVLGKAGLAGSAICRVAICVVPKAGNLLLQTKKIARESQKVVQGVVKKLSFITSGLSCPTEMCFG